MEIIINVIQIGILDHPLILDINLCIYVFMYLCCHPGCCKFTHNQHSMCYKHISCKKDPKFKQLRFQLNKQAGKAYDEMLKFIRKDNCLSLIIHIVNS